MENYALRNICGASLVVQWLRICLARQGTQVQSLVWEDTVGQLSPYATTNEPVLWSLGAATGEASMPESLCSSMRSQHKKPL